MLDEERALALDGEFMVANGVIHVVGTVILPPWPKWTWRADPGQRRGIAHPVPHS